MKLLSHIKFHVGGTEYSVKADDIDPSTTINDYLRKTLHLTGTKRMCLEGGCGSCIVAVEEVVNEKKVFFAVNSCLVSIFSCHGWKIQSIEGIGDPTTKYHPIQKLLAENNGSQCGFCSSGMVMNMFALYESGSKTTKEIENSFGSNICRCTGYRPILAAFKKLASDSEEKLNDSFKDIEDVKPCKKGECTKICNKECQEKFDSYYYQLGNTKWMKVYTVKDLLEIIETSSSYSLVAGNTARGVTKETTIADVFIDITGIEELRTYSLKGDVLILGSNMTLTETMEIFLKISKDYKNFEYLSTMAEHIDLVANVAVRNIGTVAGNLMLKYTHNDFPSDIFLILETFNAILIIVDAQENETMTSPKDFLKVDMHKKIIKSIILHGLDTSYKYLSYKIMPRAQNTHAMVNAGFLLKFDDIKVESARIVYGGINPQFVHATNTEELLKGKNLFENSVLKQAFKSLTDEINPNDNPPEPTPKYRRELAVALFYKFVLHLCPEKIVSRKNKSGGALLQRPISSGVQEFGTNKKTYPVSEPIIKIEALAQTSGQAEYIADFPDRPGQLFGAFVTAETSANSTIVTIDTSRALQLKGVVAFFGKDDVPGENSFQPKLGGFPVQEELFCSGRVQCYSQPIGIIVANSQDLAVEAATLVDVTYNPPKEKPFLDVREVVQTQVKDRIHHTTTVVPKSKGTDIKHVIKGNFYIGMQYHFHMEVQCCNVVPTEDGLDIYAATQWMDLNQLAAAAALNIPTNKINVQVRRLGGSFGGKISRSALVSTAAALAAYKLRKPVKMWIPLEKNMDIMGKRYPLFMDYEVAVNNAGVIQYLKASLYSDIGIGGNEPPLPFLPNMFKNCYDISTWSFSHYTVNTDTHANCWTRAPGTTEAVSAIESIMDHIAYTINLDSSQVRVANINKEKFPKVLEYLKDIESWADVTKRKQEINSFNKANRWKKRGMSVVPLAWTYDVFGTFNMLISIFHGDGGVVISHGGIEMGQGINTKVAQVCAYKFEIPLEMVSVKPSYNVIAPNSFISGGSYTSESVCYALIQACDVLLARMKPIREKMKNPTWAELVNKCFASNLNLSASGFYSKNSPGIESYLIYGVCATEVELDILTGQKEILRMDIIEDVGDSMNPLIDIGQTEGAIVMGIGYHTLENLVRNKAGKLLTNRTWNYTPPGAKDIPIDFRIKFPTNNPNKVGVLHSKAIGEPPMGLTIAVPLAIRNAVASAREDADPSKPKSYPFDGPTTVENTFLNSLNNCEQYVL